MLAILGLILLAVAVLALLGILAIGTTAAILIAIAGIVLLILGRSSYYHRSP